MRLFSVWTITFLVAAFGVNALGQSTESKESPATEAKGMPPRATPEDYQAQATVGAFTIAAEFVGHSVPKPEGPLSTEDYVVVEAGLFGAAGARLALSIEDFTLRLNGKKTPLSSTPYGLVSRSLRDPQWSPPEAAETKTKSKNGLSTGGQTDSPSTPPIIHIPIEMQRAMTQYIRKSSLPAGDRALPQAGLLFFPYRGKTENLRSVELIYSGPAGNATLSLTP